jgi:hypothetical protein
MSRYHHFLAATLFSVSLGACSDDARTKTKNAVAAVAEDGTRNVASGVRAEDTPLKKNNRYDQKMRFKSVNRFFHVNP